MALPKNTDHQFKLRLPKALLEQLAASANANNRSINAEIVAKLEASASSHPLTASQLADALGCFWNAAIGDAQMRQSTTALDAASVMAVGLSAVATRLEEIGQCA